MGVENSYEAWIGKTNTDHDLISAHPLNVLAATLNREAPELVVPPLWHWTQFLFPTKMSDLGSDGHSKTHDFMPPTPQPRRMRAGGSFTFAKLLEIGEQTKRISTIQNVQAKTGASGELVFVTVQHQITGDRGAEITEIENIVYREATKPGGTPSKSRPAKQMELEAHWTRSYDPNPVILFNYSAVTLNSHRIHYDRSYAMDQENYPGLVVHGPLVATLLLDLLAEQAPGSDVKSYSYTAIAPLFDTDSLQLCGRIDGNTATLWTMNNSGQLAMKAKAELTSR